MMPSASFPGLTRGAYGLIVVDPPWGFKSWSAKGHAKAPQRHYNCMPSSAINDLPIRDLEHERHMRETRR